MQNFPQIVHLTWAKCNRPALQGKDYAIWIVSNSFHNRNSTGLACLFCCLHRLFRFTMTFSFSLFMFQFISFRAAYKPIGAVFDVHTAIGDSFEEVSSSTRCFLIKLSLDSCRNSVWEFQRSCCGVNSCIWLCVPIYCHTPRVALRFKL